MERFDIQFQPKDLIPNVIFAPEGKANPEERKQKQGRVLRSLVEEDEQLCRACGWTTYNELCTSYLPRLRIFHTRVNSGLWLMGNDWMLWDRPSGRDNGNDYMTYQFLRDQGTKDIPLVKEMRQYGGPEDPFQFTIMSRAKGVPLENIWNGLSPEEKNGYAKQVTAALRELRQYTSPVPQRVDGSPLWDNIIGQCHAARCKNIGKTTEEWFDGMAEELRYGLSRRLKTQDDGVIEAELQELKDNFPDGAPYVLTHGDLNLGNIIVNNGKIEAIIDWELAGYYPWWVERWASYSRALSIASHELFDIVWGELCPELDKREFRNKVFNRIRPISDAWDRCPLAHTESEDVWLRPAFCECKPYGGVIYKKDWDAEMKHSVDYERYTSSGESQPCSL